MRCRDSVATLRPARLRVGGLADVAQCIGPILSLAACFPCLPCDTMQHCFSLSHSVCCCNPLLRFMTSWRQSCTKLGRN